MPAYVSDISQDGFDFKISVYPPHPTEGEKKPRVLMVLSDEYNEKWSIEGATDVTEYKLGFAGTKIRVYPDLDAVARKFKFDGIEKTLKAKVGAENEFPSTTRILHISGRAVLFERILTQKAMRRVHEVPMPLESEFPFRPPPAPVRPLIAEKPLKLPKVELGLGKDGMRRLRVLFESTLEGLGIKPTRALQVRAEEVIYQLDSKYRAINREQAVEQAIVNFLKWIEKNVYFKQ